MPSSTYSAGCTDTGRTASRGGWITLIPIAMELSTVYTTQGHLVAEMIKSKLESAGIPVLLDYESIGRIYGITMDGLGEVRVKVPAAFAQEALELLRESGGEAEEKH
jgi:hypothetical protein